MRKACLEAFPQETVSRQIVPVAAEMLHQDRPLFEDPLSHGLALSLHGVSIYLTEDSFMSLLSQVLEVIRNAQ